MRYEVRYRCRFRYEEPAAESQNELRAAPSTDRGQHVLHARVTVEPSARVLTTTDYWGTRVDAFGVRQPHDRLEVTVDAAVEVADPPPPPAAAPMAATRDLAFRDAHREFLVPSPLAQPDDAVRELAHATAPDSDDAWELARAFEAAVDAAVEHVAGVTEVGTPIGEALADGRGVCQDRAHLLVALCRERGVPARYVSGYLCDGPSGADTTTHAWAEVALPEHGWQPLDPSDGGADDQHRIVIGRGRDYADVPPLKGTYLGGAARELEVEVHVSQVAPVTADAQ